MTGIRTTKRQREILEHAIGHPPKGKQKPYRNYYCAEVGSPDAVLIDELVSMGLMTKGPLINDGRDFYAYVTEAGASEVNGTLPKAPAHDDPLASFPSPRPRLVPRVGRAGLLPASRPAR